MFPNETSAVSRMKDLCMGCAAAFSVLPRFSLSFSSLTMICIVCFFGFIFQEMQVQSLDWEDPLEREMATQSSILAWRIPWTEEPGGLQSTGSQRVGHNWVTKHEERHKDKWLVLEYLKHNLQEYPPEAERRIWPWPFLIPKASFPTLNIHSPKLSGEGSRTERNLVRGGEWGWSGAK